MYEYIKGTIAELTPASVVIDVSGVGYLMNISLQTFESLADKSVATIYVHHIVREDAQLFFGFGTRQERELFRLLIGVSGIGGNTARMILSAFTPDELVTLIATGNSAMLKSVKGIGAKTAERVIIELRDKVIGIAAVDTPSGANVGSGSAYEEALAALAMLGFARAASDKVVRSLLKNDPSMAVEDLVRQSLKNL